MKKKKTKRIILITVIVIAALSVAAAVYALVINGVVVRAGKDKLVDTEGAVSFEADCILVLGAGLKPDGTPSDMLADRIKTAVELYEAGAAPCLLLSGDNSRKDYDETTAMKDYASSLGVPEEALICDFAGFSTYESIYRARDIFSAKKIIIVTQEYHLYRALYIADALGVDAAGVRADVRKYRGQAVRELREILARNKDFIYTIIKPEPTYLGDKIPLPER